MCAGAHAEAPSPERHAEETTAGRGFSFFLGLGQQSLRYRESARLLPVNSEARTHSPLLITGALYAFNQDVLFSLDSEQTFYPAQSTETWRTSAAVFNGITLTSPVIQQNRYSLSQSQTQVLVHHRLHDAWFVIGGPKLRSQSFRRFAFAGGPDGALNPSPDQTVEETSSEVVLNLGIALESERVKGVKDHYGLRATAGLPIWRRVENSSQPLAQFNSVKGYDLVLEGRFSRAVLQNVHLGGWGQWSLARRSYQQATGNNGAAVELPSSRLDGWSYGVELLWKL